MAFIILGVHPIKSSEPCHLLEVDWKPESGTLDWNGITQEIENQPRANWQAAYDEQSLGNHRWAFFFHYLDLNKPLLTPEGAVILPAPSVLPTHLRHIKYFEVD